MKFELLHKIEFNSDRKRMTIVLKDLSDGEVYAYSKGADSVMKVNLNI
jgi:magnesium-transporting ATPase (P-type)